MDVRGIAGLLAACSIVAACSSGGGADERVGAEVPREPYDPAAEQVDDDDVDGGSQATVDDDVEPDEPDEPDDPYAIPDEITPEYLDRVFEALNAVDLEIQREIVARDAIPQTALDRLAAIYGFFALDDELAGYTAVLAEERTGEYAGGPLIVTAERVVHVESGCVAVLTKQDRSSLLREPPPVSTAYTVLVRVEEPGITRTNPTPWKIAARVRADTVGIDKEVELCRKLESEYSQ